MTQAIQAAPSRISTCFKPIAEAWRKTAAAVGGVFKKLFEPIAGYFLKICVFRDAALQGRCSRSFMTPIARGIVNLWMKTQKIPNKLDAFDPARLKRSEAFLTEFAEMRTIRTADGVELKWALFTPERFNQWIADNGGVRDGEWIRPRSDADWPRLQRLKEFKMFPEWLQEEGRAFRIPAPVPGAENKCVLRCQGFGRSIPMDKAFIGLHLAAGFSYAVFDWRPKINAKGFFEDAEAAFQAVRAAGFAPQQIKAMGSCRATFVVSRLKELHHQEGLDVVMMHTPPSLEAIVANQTWPANKIGLCGLGAIERDGAHFDTLRRLEGLAPGPSRTCLIMSEGDKTVPADTIERLARAAQRIGETDLILEPKVQGGHDPHFGEPLRDAEVLRRYFAFLGA